MEKRKPGKPARPLQWRREGACIVVTGMKPGAGGYYSIERRSKGQPRKVFKLHRLVCERRHGVLGELHVLHSCDNRACINPDHLRPGTHLQNIADCVGKERHARGEKVKQHKLTTAQVREIRASPEYQTVLADRYGVTQSCISRVRTKRDWKHVC